MNSKPRLSPKGQPGKYLVQKTVPPVPIGGYNPYKLATKGTKNTKSKLA